MSVEISDKVIDSIVSNVAYNSGRQNDPILAEFEEQLKTRMQEKGITSLDDSEGGLEVARWVQEYTIEKSGISPHWLAGDAGIYSEKGILSWDDAAFAEAENNKGNAESDKGETANNAAAGESADQQQVSPTDPKSETSAQQPKTKPEAGAKGNTYAETIAKTGTYDPSTANGYYTEYKDFGFSSAGGPSTQSGWDSVYGSSSSEKDSGSQASGGSANYNSSSSSNGSVDGFTSIYGDASGTGKETGNGAGSTNPSSGNKSGFSNLLNEFQQDKETGAGKSSTPVNEKSAGYSNSAEGQNSSRKEVPKTTTGKENPQSAAGKNNNVEVDVSKPANENKSNVDLGEKSDTSKPQSELAFKELMNSVEGTTSEWRRGDLPGGGTVENVKEVAFFVRDKNTGKPVGNPAATDPFRLSASSSDADIQALLNSDDKEIYGAEIIWEDGVKVWTSTGETGQEDFKKFVDYGVNGIKWQQFEKNMLNEPIRIAGESDADYKTKVKEWKDSDPKEYKNKSFKDEGQFIVSNVQDLGGNRYTWTEGDGKRYWANLGDIKDNRLKHALTLKDEKGNSIQGKVLTERNWNRDFFNTSGDKAIDYDSIKKIKSNVGGEQKEFYVFSAKNDKTNAPQTYMTEVNASADGYYDTQHMLFEISDMKNGNAESYNKLNELAKSGDAQLLYRTIGDNDARYGSMDKSAFKKGKAEITLESGSPTDGDAIWKVKVNGNSFIVAQEIPPNHIDRFTLEVDGKKVDSTWDNLTAFLAENDNN